MFGLALDYLDRYVPMSSPSPVPATSHSVLDPSDLSSYLSPSYDPFGDVLGLPLRQALGESIRAWGSDPDELALTEATEQQFQQDWNDKQQQIATEYDKKKWFWQKPYLGNRTHLDNTRAEHLIFLLVDMDIVLLLLSCDVSSVHVGCFTIACSPVLALCGFRVWFCSQSGDLLLNMTLSAKKDALIQHRRQRAIQQRQQQQQQQQH
jgi:hypothetical protein